MLLRRAVQNFGVRYKQHNTVTHGGLNDSEGHVTPNWRRILVPRLFLPSNLTSLDANVAAAETDLDSNALEKIIFRPLSLRR